MLVTLCTTSYPYQHRSEVHVRQEVKLRVLFGIVRDFDRLAKRCLRLHKLVTKALVPTLPHQGYAEAMPISGPVSEQHTPSTLSRPPPGFVADTVLVQPRAG